MISEFISQTTLIRKVKKLKVIKPSKNWVLLNKDRILGEDKSIEIFPFLRPAYAMLFCVLFLLGMFEISQDALPGESLYYLKKIAEKSQVLLSSEQDKPKLNLELANKRLEELSQIAETNEVKKLAPALKEYQASVSEVVKNMKIVVATSSDSAALKECALQTQKLEQNKERVEEVLAAKIDTEDYNNALSGLVERLISDIEKTTLLEEKQEILDQVKESFKNEDYSGALEKILLNF